MAADQLKLLKTERANVKRQLTTTLHDTEALISEENYDEIDKTKLYELQCTVKTFYIKWNITS